MPAVWIGMRRIGPLAAFAFALLTFGAFGAGLEPSRPAGGSWWVVVASPDIDAYYAATTNADHPYWREVGAARRKAASCGYEIMVDQAARFDGFDANRMAFVAGGFPDRDAASAALARLRPCFADAYLKQGRYTDWN